MEWVNDGQWIARCGLYSLCWTGYENPTFVAIHNKKSLLITKDEQAAIRACEEHKRLRDEK